MAPDETDYKVSKQVIPEGSHLLPEANTKCYDYVVAKTGVHREACKFLICAWLYGGPLVAVCHRYKLTIDIITDIRMAFDDFVEGR